MTELPAVLFQAQREEWRSKAACKGANPNIFVLDQGFTAAEAIKYCKRCEVTEECANFARRTRSIGVFGGKLFTYRQPQPVELLPIRRIQDARPVSHLRSLPGDRPLILGAPVQTGRPSILGR